MAIKATFTAGSDSTTVRGLYQWDYGRELEIESADIGTETGLEVHFAASNMNEAIIRSCTFTNGIGRVIIPDACLEQSSPVTAWIYKIRGTEGHTLKTITMPITARIRPCVSRDIPTAVSDKYTELITEVNEAVDALENGTVTVAKAVDAQRASHATSAGNASTANYATSAGSANTAGTATSANEAQMLASGWKVFRNGTDDVTKVFKKDKVYAVAFPTKESTSNNTALQTVILAGYGLGVSAISSRGPKGYCTIQQTILKFFDQDDTQYTPSLSTYYREI